MKQKMKKLIFLMIRLVCGVLFHTNHRTYMKLYVPLLRWMGVHVTGEPRYIGFHVKFDDYSRIALGDRTTISDGCILLTHDYSFTTALIAGGRKPRTDIAIIRDIQVGNNVFIGKQSIVMPGTVIPDNVIIGAGSVVRGHLQGGAIYLGNPAVQVRNIAEQLEKWEKKLDPSQFKIDK